MRDVDSLCLCGRVSVGSASCKVRSVAKKDARLSDAAAAALSTDGDFTRSFAGFALLLVLDFDCSGLAVPAATEEAAEPAEPAPECAECAEAEPDDECAAEGATEELATDAVDLLL